MVRRFIQKFRCNERGNALVEAAIVLPVAILVLLGGFELARTISYVHAADKAVRDVSRYLARVKSATAPTADTAKQLLLADNLLAISSSDLDTLTVTVDSSRFAAGYVSIQAAVTYKVWLLSVVFPDPTFTFTVSHEQPYIGE